MASIVGRILGPCMIFTSTTGILVLVGGSLFLSSSKLTLLLLLLLLPLFFVVDAVDADDTDNEDAVEIH